MFACFGEAGCDQSSSGVGGREKRIRHVLRFEKRRWGGGSGAFSCFAGSGIDADGSLGLAGDSEGGSMVSRQSQVYDPSLAKKTLCRAERTLYERLKDSEEMMPLPLFRKEDVNEEAFMSPKGALDEYLFENVPDASMQLGQERHRREVCSSKIQEIERELQEFSEIFGSKLVELKKSMGEFAQSMKELMHYDEGNYIEDRLWEEADTNSKAVDTVTSSQSPRYR
ncbi:unnamed protein product [Calypogeia fissa]